MFNRSQASIIVWLTTVFATAMASGQPTTIDEASKKNEDIMITPRWEITIQGLTRPGLSPDGSAIACTVKDRIAGDRIVLLNAANGKILWENSDCDLAVFGYDPNNVFARRRNNPSTIQVLETRSGNAVTDFKCPPNVWIDIQTDDGYFYWCDKGDHRIVRFRSDDASVEVLFDYKMSGWLFGDIRRVPHVTLLNVQEGKLFFSANSRLGVLDLTTKNIDVPTQEKDALLWPHKMLQRSCFDAVLYTATRDAIVSVDKEGHVRELIPTKSDIGVELAFLTRNRQLLISADGNTKHQPSYIVVYDLVGRDTKRIPWHSSGISSIIPQAEASMFISHNRSGTIAMWDITTSPATVNGTDTLPNNRTKR